jgi:uncharacterized repeat protein (TIGR01451 family)
LPVNITRYDAHARAYAALAVGLIALPAAMATGHPSTPRATRAPELTISISDGRVAARPGDTLTYRISLRNTGTVTAGRLEITQTLSAGLEVTEASGNGVVKDGRVTWFTAVPAGATLTFLASARVTRPPVQMLRLAATACVAPPGARQPIVCAAHLDELPAVARAAQAGKAGTAEPARRPGTGIAPYAAAAIAALAGCLFAVLFTRRTRLRRRPPAVATAKHRDAVPQMSLPAAPNANSAELPWQRAAPGREKDNRTRSGPAAIHGPRNQGGNGGMFQRRGGG